MKYKCLGFFSVFLQFFQVAKKLRPLPNPVSIMVNVCCEAWFCQRDLSELCCWKLYSDS